MPFDDIMKTNFTVFDARQRYICIERFLRGQIDFDRYLETGVIVEHYPLQRLKLPKIIRESSQKYQGKLSRNLICGDWFKYS